MAEKTTNNTIEKIVVNVGLGDHLRNNNFESKILPEIEKELSLIAGQQPVRTYAKKSIAGFDIREGDTVGLKVTLRDQKKEDFFSRVINVALPRVRDFKGIDLNNVDDAGNLNIGFTNKNVFPEINADESSVDFGLQLTTVSNIESREDALDFYRAVGVPLKKQEETN